MILDSYKAHKVIFQVTYGEAYELWDRAGAIGRQLSKEWPGLTVQEGKPQNQTFVGKGVVIQTGISSSSVTLSGDKAFEQRNIIGLKNTFSIWREMMELSILTRASTRAVYRKKFDSMKEANAELFSLDLAHWPESKVFDQPTDTDKNGLEITYRFEDEDSFSVLRVKAEQIKAEVQLDAELFEEPILKRTLSHLVIDFDRGLLGSVDASKFRVDEWLKGYQHVLRRDIEKVLRRKGA